MDGYFQRGSFPGTLVRSNGQIERALSCSLLFVESKVVSFAALGLKPDATILQTLIWDYLEPLRTQMYHPEFFFSHKYRYIQGSAYCRIRQVLPRFYV